MNENFLNAGNSKNLVKIATTTENMNINCSLEEFAKKLRMEKYDINELKKIKNEAALNEKHRNNKKISTIKIQANVLGFLFRKKFKIYMYVKKSFLIK